jgi:hypothetical protein
MKATNWVCLEYHVGVWGLVKVMIGNTKTSRCGELLKGNFKESMKDFKTL